MKNYELTVLFHPDLEMNLDPALDKVKKLIKTNNGKITKEEAEGKKRLMYPIKGQDYAVFYYFDVELSAEAPGKISSAINITDEVLRHLIVRADAKRREVAAKEEPKETNAEKGE